MFAAHLLVEGLEHLLQAIDLSLRLFEMRLEGVSQLRRTRGLGQFRQRLCQLAFAVVGVAQFVDECVVQGSCFSHGHNLLGTWDVELEVFTRVSPHQGA